jgi:hypothetical protein
VSDKAAAWIDCVIAYGAVLLILLLQDWRAVAQPRIAIILAAAFLSYCMRVRIPGITGAYSLSFIVVLVAMTTCTLHETVLIATLAAVVQTGWQTRVTPASRYFLFNASVLLASVTAGHAAYRALTAGVLADNHAAAIAVTAVVYGFVNTALVAVTLVLLGEGSLTTVWRRWSLWTVPYYAAGTAVAGALRPGATPESVLALIGAVFIGYWCWGLALEGRRFLTPRRANDGARPPQSAAARPGLQPV